MVEKPEDTVWIGLEYFCAEGDDFWNMSEEDCVKFATAELVKMGVANFTQSSIPIEKRSRKHILLILIHISISIP